MQLQGRVILQKCQRKFALFQILLDKKRIKFSATSICITAYVIYTSKNITQWKWSSLVRVKLFVTLTTDTSLQVLLKCKNFFPNKKYHWRFILAYFNKPELTIYIFRSFRYHFRMQKELCCSNSLIFWQMPALLHSITECQMLKQIVWEVKQLK